MDPKKRSSDKASYEMLKYVNEAGLETAWDRFDPVESTPLGRGHKLVYAVLLQIRLLRETWCE